MCDFFAQISVSNLNFFFLLVIFLLLLPSALQTASKSLMDAVTEVYEEQWVGADALRLQASSVEVLFQDFSHKLGDQVLLPLNTYSTQFPEMRVTIDLIITFFH